MAQWEHIGCGTIVDGGRLPPANCTFCIASIVLGEEPGWRRVGTAVRHTPKRTSRGSIGAEKRRRIYERDGWKCVQCGGGSLPRPGYNLKDELTLDHKIPVSKGGGNEESNLQTMCGPCNRDKADKMPDEVG